ncbi:hypothetical protein GJ654_18590 [Rhodoblastus acidophilus]|uniref:Uncharacterized protein n=1 Tax=Rhodoblastus acidophilus TaxID=1074 RepID=A0A6N8DQU9_RHOAC|nr:hypothetical protein [Rhodoblastus acidophilus]MCW2276332.1 hypothetical protein [Rhodoblastus acidophilus]MTV32992.1 hypothetical protein [Rhodoblastus acidophilus]
MNLPLFAKLVEPKGPASSAALQEARVHVKAEHIAEPDNWDARDCVALIDAALEEKDQ